MGSMGTKFEFKFKQENSDVNKRKQLYDKIKQTYPNRIPIVVEKDPESVTLNDIDKTKYLIPCSLTAFQFNFGIRKRLRLNESEALFLMAKGKHIISGEITMKDVYEKYSDKEDGFLYITYMGALTWGSN